MNNKILIVEDNFVNRNILSNILKEKYDVLETSDGVEALAVIREQYRDISAVILDLQMPQMSGKELLEILSKQEKYSNLPILIATGEHNDELESECLQLGAWDFVTKPYNPIVLLLRLRNIISRSQMHLIQQIQLLAERDLLTGIYNRRYFMKQTAEMIQKNSHITFVMIRLDIDQFRLYNSSFGSEAGDELLKGVANQLRRQLSEYTYKCYTYGRIDADIFGICIPYEKDTLESRIGKTEQEMQNRFESYRLKLSFGLYVIEDRTLDMEKIYANAAEAARKCKNNINKFFVYYNDEMGKKEEKAQQLTNEMERGILERQFQVYLQPKYSIESNNPCGAEALVRWMHPKWGMVSPGEFIPVFEQNGLIVQLDYYMWESVCALLKKWLDEGCEPYPVSVNVSRISMFNPQIADSLVNLTDKYQVPRRLLHLEITESAYMSNPDLMKDIITKLRESGFAILMDDFGSGYSSLNTLKDIDVDILKVDMKFLPTGNNNAKSEKILASVTRMAGWLGIPVIVEGVETKEQKEFLESIGSSYAQGYYFAKPMPVEDYEKLMREQKAEEQYTEGLSADLLDDFDTIWSSDSTTSALLKSVSVPFAIIECADNKIDVLRMNQAYVKEFGSGALDEYLITQEMDNLQTAVQEALISKKNGECECLFLMPEQTNKWYQIRLNYIGTVEKTSLISATFIDVTVEHKMEKELNTVFRVIKGKKGERGKLLVIDDLEVSRELIRTMFDGEYEVITAEDGEEGLKVLRENMEHIAAILLDMLMPRMGGQEFLSYKNRIPEAADIPVIVISSERSEKIQINMLENGVNDYITKPFVPAVVKKRLQNVIEYNSRFRTLVREYKQQ